MQPTAMNPTGRPAPQMPISRPYSNWHMDSRRWEAYSPHSSDIFVAAMPKSGTTWTMGLLYHLLVRRRAGQSGKDEAPGGEGERGESVVAEEPGVQAHGSGGGHTSNMWDMGRMEWLDAPIIPWEHVLKRLQLDAAVPGRQRVIKTHTPRDGIPFYSCCKYIVMVRDLRDVAWSWFHHWGNVSDEGYRVFEAIAPVYGEMPRHPPNAAAVFRDMMREDAGFYPGHSQYRPGEPVGDGWPFHLWSFTRTWWAVRDQPNVLLIHYNWLLEDLEGELRRIVAFLGLALSDGQIAESAARLRFSTMKREAWFYSPVDSGLRGGATTFFNKGVNGRWKGQLTEEEVRAYEERAVKELGTEAAEFLLNGKRSGSGGGASGPG